MGCHPSHKTRFSWDASSFDYICEVCGATDQTPGGWGLLAEPCPGPRRATVGEAESKAAAEKRVDDMKAYTLGN